MKLTIIPLLCLYGFTAVAAEENVLVTSYYCGRAEEGQTAFYFEIPISRAKQLPSWAPDTSQAAPVSLSAACVIAKQALQTRYATTNAFEVRTILLQPMASFGTWYYNIECQTTKFDRWSSPCGMRAVVLMDGGSVEPRVEGRDSDLSETLRQANRKSFDLERQFARARMGDTNALVALLVFGPNIDPAKSPGFGSFLIELLGELGDTNFARFAAEQTTEVKTAIAGHLAAGATHTRAARLRRPITEAFPLTHAALTDSGR